MGEILSRARFSGGKDYAGGKSMLQHRVRIGPPHPLACRKRRLNGAVLRKTESLCHSRCGTIKIPPCSKALSSSIGLNFAALHRQWWRLHISEIFLSGT
jgi:hypothetical protein